MFGINGGEFLVILLVAAIVIGPTRLPRYAEQLARLTKQARRFLQDAKERVGDELGDEVKDIDWEALDPRKYDPRRIVRDALSDVDPLSSSSTRARGSAARPGTASPGASSASRATTTGTAPAAGPTTATGTTGAATAAAATTGVAAAGMAATGAATPDTAPVGVDVAPDAPFDDEAT